MTSESVGQHIPQELFEGIIAYACRTACDSKTWDPRNRQRWSSLSLVSRYWAIIYRRHMYRTIWFRSEAGLRTFRALLDSTPPTLKPLTRHVRRLHCLVYSTEAPWLHLMSARIVPIPFHRHMTVEVTIDAGTTADAAKLHTHLGVPRPLPTSRSPVQKLELHDVKLQSGIGLLKILTTFSRLESVRLSSVRWATDPDQHTFSSLALGPSLSAIKVKKSNTLSPVSAISITLWLLPALIARRTSRANVLPVQPGPDSTHLHPSDYHTFLRMVDIIRPAPGQPTSTFDSARLKLNPSTANGIISDKIYSYTGIATADLLLFSRIVPEVS